MKFGDTPAGRTGIGRIAAGAVISVVLFIAVSVYFGRTKEVVFCDEVYTYLLSNSMNPNSQYVENVWFTNDYTYQILTTQRGSGFEHTLFNVRYDVHPPLYFITFHALSMIFGGDAGPWAGILINIACQLVTLLCLYFLAYRCSRSTVFAVMACAAFTFFPFVISNTLLIRMYSMLSMWTALYMTAGYFLTVGGKQVLKSWYLYALLFAATVGGFLTQYYFSIFAVGFTLGFLIYSIVRKRPGKAVAFIGTMVLAVAASTLLWRYWIDHIFGGYRGEQAFANLASVEALLSAAARGLVLCFEFLFGNYMGYAVLVLAAAAIVLLAVSGKADEEYAYACISFSAAEFTSVLILMVTSDDMFADRYFFAAGEALWIALSCLFGLAVRGFKDRKAKPAALAFPAAVLVLSLTRTSYITWTDLDGTLRTQRESLKNYNELPWVYYGGEDWKLVGNLMDFLIPDEYVVLSAENDYSDNEKLKSASDFIMYVKDTYYDPKGAFEEMEEALDCTLNAEYLFDRGYAKVFLVHKMQNE